MQLPDDLKKEVMAEVYNFKKVLGTFYLFPIDQAK